jgi:hypothetical protein
LESLDPLGLIVALDPLEPIVAGGFEHDGKEARQ